jgi:hypothetical protein
MNGRTPIACGIAAVLLARIETPTLRGVNVQRLFGSQRALKSIEDFTEFEQRGAYFDGDPTGTRLGGQVPVPA